MRICLVTEFFYPDTMGSTGKVLSALIRYLSDNHPDIHIDAITTRNQYRGEKGILDSFEDWDGVHITRISCPPTNHPSTAFRLLLGTIFSLLAFLKLLFRPRYDVLFFVTNPPVLPIVGTLMKTLKRTPYVYLIHDLFPDVAVRLNVLSSDSVVAKLAKVCQRHWLSKSSKVVVLGRCMKKYLIDEYGLPSSNIEVITNWADTGIHPIGKDTEFRRKNGLTGSVILYAGNFGLHQKFETILDAAKIVQEKGLAITFCFVGDGAKKEAILRDIKEKGLENVRCFPFVPHEKLQDLLASADISLVTLEPGMEGLGVPSKFYNLLASGRPIISLAAKDSEVSCTVEEAECGIVVDQDQPKALVDAVISISQNPVMLSKMGEQSYKAFITKYTLEMVGDCYYRVLKEVVR